MCNWEPSNSRIKLHHPTENGEETAWVDSCIAPLVQSLNKEGYQTVASCCGYGDLFSGFITFDDEVPDLHSLLLIRSQEEFNEVAAYHIGHCLSHVPKHRWKAFSHLFNERFEKAMKGEE